MDTVTRKGNRPMKLQADRDLCIGAGMCALTAPGVFDQDDDGLVVQLVAEPADAQAQLARDAVNACPSGAISIME